MSRALTILIFAAVIFTGSPAPAQAHKLSTTRAVHRAEAEAKAIEQRSAVISTYVVAGCEPVGTTGHRMDCMARLRGENVLCRVRIRVRVKSAESLGTLAITDRLDCRSVRDKKPRE